MKTSYLKIAFVALLISFAPSFLTQCCYRGGCCGNTKSHPYFNLLGMTSVSYRVDTTTNSYTTQPYDQRVIHHRKYFCWLRSEVEYHSQTPTRWDFGQSAFACSPAPNGDLGSQEKITSIRVYSNADYTSNLPAGTDLASVFQIYAQNSGEYAYSPSSEQRYTTLPTYLATEKPAFYSAYLRIATAPTVSKKHAFKIEYTQRNGEKYTVQTPEITFQ